MKKLLTFTTVLGVLVLLSVPQNAEARSRVYFNLNVNPAPYYVAPQPYYYVAPAPMYVGPSYGPSYYYVPHRHVYHYAPGVVEYYY
jgi:hypothetical protein